MRARAATPLSLRESERETDFSRNDRSSAWLGHASRSTLHAARSSGAGATEIRLWNSPPTERKKPPTRAVESRAKFSVPLSLSLSRVSSSRINSPVSLLVFEARRRNKKEREQKLDRDSLGGGAKSYFAIHAAIRCVNAVVPSGRTFRRFPSASFSLSLVKHNARKRA